MNNQRTVTTAYARPAAGRKATGDAAGMQPSTMLMNLARVLLTPVLLGDRRRDLLHVTSEASRIREILGTDAVESSSCSVEALNRDLSGKKVWVFLGHTDAPLCGDRTLAFSRDGVPEVVQISTIVEIVRSHQLELVVLNGCDGLLQNYMPLNRTRSA